MTPLPDTLEELVTTGQGPVYVVHFTQKDAVEHATTLLKAGWVPKPDLGARLDHVRFGAGFGKTLNKLLRRGIGVHHAGMLPRYRRLVEQLAQAGLLERRAATTHHDAYDELAAISPTTQVVRGQRFVRSAETILTSAGVSAGVDLALHVVQLLAGQATRDVTVTEMEWM